MARRTGFKKGNFMLVSQTGFSQLQQLARAKRLGVRDLRVFMEMLANISYENMVMVGHRDLARLTGIDVVGISKCVRALLETGLIQRVNDRRGWYCIDPRFAWKGDGEPHREAIAEREHEAESALRERVTAHYLREVG